MSESKSKSIDHAYTEGDSRTLDPTLLDMSAIDRMPDPTGWRMLVLPYAGQAKTKSGILLTKETLDRESLAMWLKKGRFAITTKKNLAKRTGVKRKHGCLLADTQAQDSS